MDGLGANPFAILTFIAAPAILTNSSSVMALGTSNRFARALDRARAVSAQIPRGAPPTAEVEQWTRLLRLAERRALFLVRALSAFYLAVGSFSAASLASLLGAVFFIGGLGTLHYVALALAFCAGVTGIGGLVFGTGMLVWETRMTLRILLLEISLRRGDLTHPLPPAT